MAGFLGKIFGGNEKTTELNSCCGAVSVTPEEETTSETEQQVEVKATEPSLDSR
jgi:SepF-like predicted cell division protein (DUF552 family)